MDSTIPALSHLRYNATDLNKLQQKLRFKSSFFCSERVSLVKHQNQESLKYNFRFKQKADYQAGLYSRPKPLSRQWDDFKRRLNTHNNKLLDDIFKKPVSDEESEKWRKHILNLPENRQEDVLKQAGSLINPSTEELPETEADKAEFSKPPTGLSAVKIDIDLNLFFSLSHRISRTMGEDSLGKFLNVTEELNTRYQYDFKIKIQRVGSYLSNSEQALNLDPEAWEEFTAALDNVIGFDSDNEKLDEFMDAADDFFNSLGEMVPQAGESLNLAKEQVVNTVKNFFSSTQEILASPASKMISMSA